MRWIDIILPAPKTSQEFDILMEEATYLTGTLHELQKRHGLDSPQVIDQMSDVGRRLFRAISEHDNQAFSPTDNQLGDNTPEIGVENHDQLTGYHIVTEGGWASLPWVWLHNGLEFLLEKHPICTATTSSGFPGIAEQRPWMSRCLRAGFLVGDEGKSGLDNTIDQLRPEDLAQPEILFIPGHSEEPIRRLIFREAEAIEGALSGGRLGQSLANLDFPKEAVTPAQLKEHGINYQAIHFAGPTSEPAMMADTHGEYWMNQLIDEVNVPADLELEGAMGVEAEVLGVDPITSLLDSVSDKYDREGLSESRVGSNISKIARFGESSSSCSGQSEQSLVPWLLDDGPVEPESLGAGGGVPPLVFSNSYLALPELGMRFTKAGASTFVGPVAPLFSRPARIFTGYLYNSLADGWSTGGALWNASRKVRQELGSDHPAWLSYGIRGYGTLALQYL